MEEEAIPADAQNRTPLPPITLILGGAKSGKSRFAEELVSTAGNGTYIATAEARDGEMRARIERHKDRRGNSWQTIEAPLDLVGALTQAEQMGTAVLVDCLTLWLSNLMEADRNPEKETDDLISRLSVFRDPVVMVSNEVGQGIVPLNPLARRFRDQMGILNQAMAAFADQVFFVTAGISTRLK